MILEDVLDDDEIIMYDMHLNSSHNLAILNRAPSSINLMIISRRLHNSSVQVRRGP